ncbi:hypothetical protein Cgig2_000228 [Carnegiea gigantea]|uniref:LOB domain-containing protein n=1 Tax=Carnegiea gigantea TaxID=171969 RepID=A0A9Q1Q6U0_9CARY|nr:hypothetical protein Cgig2_000228 [Carnegiea gigantea]
MTVKGGTIQACAACKYQRRRCTPDCPLAPYFPANKPEMFRNAHRLFGVRNIVRILEQLRDDQKDEAMKSIIFESDMRERFPVFGCCLVIWQLEEQVQRHQQELFYVNSLLMKFRNKDNNPQIQMPMPPQYSPTSQFQLGLVPSNDSGNFQYQATSNEMGFVANGNNNLGFVECSDVMGKPSFWMQQQQQQQEGSNYYANNLSCNNNDDNGNVNMNVNSFGMTSSNIVAPQMLPLQQEIEMVSHEYDDMPFDTIADDRQSYIESIEACESSVDSPMKDTMRSIGTMSQNHDLKSAAACFSLTSVN